MASMLPQPDSHLSRPPLISKHQQCRIADTASLIGEIDTGKTQLSHTKPQVIPIVIHPDKVEMNDARATIATGKLSTANIVERV